MNETPTFVKGREEIETTQVKRTGRFMLIFKTEWWETVRTDSIGNDIHIKTERPIRQVFLNGEPLMK